MSISSRIILTYAKINNHKFTLIILVPKVTLKIDPSGKPTPTENSNVAPQPFLPITAPYICLACCQITLMDAFFSQMSVKLITSGLCCMTFQDQ